MPVYDCGDPSCTPCTIAFRTLPVCPVTHETDAQKVVRLTDLLSRMIDDIDCLADESDGIAGLHLNGDVATWGQLMPGGQFERLSTLEEARSAVQGSVK